MGERDVCGRKLYKIPCDEILENRREFYGLARETSESIETWLYRVFSHIDVCDFPKSVEYILTDKFVCELDADERAFIRKADPNWAMQFEVSKEANAADDADQSVELDSTVDIDIDMDMSVNSNSIVSSAASPIPSTSTSLDSIGETTHEQDIQTDDGIDTSHKLYKCRKCNAVSPDLKAHTKHRKTAHQQLRYICKVCDRRFVLPSQLSRHAVTHKKEKMSFCNRCHQGFTRLASLIEHKRKVHSSKGGAHQCRVCGKRCSSLRALNSHAVAHIGKKLYECSVCQKDFNVLYHLKQHTKVKHHGFRPHACSVCHEKFQSLYFLKKHLNEQHSGKSPHTCGVCDKAFVHMAALIQHKRFVHKE